MNNLNLHHRELRTEGDLDPFNYKTRDISFDESVAIVRHQGEYGDLTIVSTINQLLDKLKAEDYSITHSKHANRIFAHSDAQGQGYSVCFEYYTLS
jgi:hypothetical protein